MPDRRLARVLGRWFVICAVALISGSFVPYVWKVQWGLHGRQHFRAHVIVFMLLGLMAFLSVHTLQSRLRRTVGLGLLALTIEILQSLWFGNRFEWPDIQADIIGALFTLTIVQLLSFWTEYLKGKAINRENAAIAKGRKT